MSADRRGQATGAAGRAPWRPSGRWGIGLLFADLIVLAAVNLLRFPLSVPSQRALTGETYLDMCGFCSAAEEHRILTAFGDAGRAAQLRFLLSIDVVIPLLGAAFGVVALAHLSRYRWLLALPVAAMGLDFAENAAVAAAVWRYPAPASGAAGLLSGLKFVAYAATWLAIAVVAVAARWRRGGPPPRRGSGPGAQGGHRPSRPRHRRAVLRPRLRRQPRRR